jgi:uncharacterized cupredoxin-like copper-binding protein
VAGLRARHALLLPVLASLMGATAPTSDTGTRTVELTAHHSRFSASVVTVAKGSTVRFVVRNTDPIDHELIVGDEAVQLRHEHGTEAHHGARPGEVSVPAGKTVSTTYTFTSPGRLLFGCHLPGHWSYGMHGTIVVR